MKNQNVKFSFNLLCDWKKSPPTYRVYVNNELFTERTYAWGVNQYVKENLSIYAPPGKYSVRIDHFGDETAVFKIRNLQINDGLGCVLDSQTIEVYNETT